jgi:hypothetical protein
MWKEAAQQLNGLYFGGDRLGLGLLCNMCHNGVCICWRVVKVEGCSTADKVYFSGGRWVLGLLYNICLNSVQMGGGECGRRQHSNSTRCTLVAAGGCLMGHITQHVTCNMSAVAGGR